MARPENSVQLKALGKENRLLSFNGRIGEQKPRDPKPCGVTIIDRWSIEYQNEHNRNYCHAEPKVFIFQKRKIHKNLRDGISQLSGQGTRRSSGVKFYIIVFIKHMQTLVFTETFLKSAAPK